MHMRNSSATADVNCDMATLRCGTCCGMAGMSAQCRGLAGPLGPMLPKPLLCERLHMYRSRRFSVHAKLDGIGLGAWPGGVLTSPVGLLSRWVLLACGPRRLSGGVLL